MSDLLRTPLYPLHIAANARMVPFAGYEMPVQYPMGIKKEHLHTRQQAGLFDVSHMGQIRLSGDGVAQALEALIPADIVDLPIGKQRYGLLTNDNGGVIDDLMIGNYGDFLLLVVNAACKEKDIAHLKQHLPQSISLEVMADQALLALQGPQAAAVINSLAPETLQMQFMDVAELNIKGFDCLISRSGYTGEDGFEISVAAKSAESLCKTLLNFPAVEWVGLGARDSLRLEAGLCLYGHELEEDTSPIEASLLWSIGKVRRADGSRPGNFPGAEIIYQQINGENLNRKRVGLQSQGKAPVREGAQLFDSDNNPIGVVTSGGYSPSLERPIAMGFVTLENVEIGKTVFADVRGKLLPMKICKTPFIQPNYFRG